MHLMILCPVWLVLGTFPASAWSWTKDGFVDSVLAEYGAYDQAARADTVKDGIITESEFMTSLYRQADVHGNNDNKVSRDEFIDYYGQRFNISSELGTVMFDILNDPNSRDDFITSADVSISSFSGKNYATVAEFRDALEKWLRQSADRLYQILMSPHVLDTKREPEIKYNVIINSMNANNDDVISTEELNDELKRMNSNQPVSRRDWVWRNTQRYGTDPVTANLVFDYWDRDRDFQLTPRDLQYLTDDMDLNGDSKVDRDEFVRFVERGYQLSKRMTAKPLTVTMVRCPDPWWDSLGWSPNVDAHRAAMDFDDDLNGWVTLADLRRWLDVFDDDDDKSISRREYTKYHTERYGVNSTVASAMFDLSDINGDEKLNEQDWEFHFRDGFSVSFCDARRSILDLARMAEQFRGVRQGRELRESMQRRLQEEWSWYLQNKQQDASSNRYMANTYNRDSNSRQQDLCGSRATCYVGEYTEVWGQPEAWLWWGIKTSFGKPEVLQTPHVGTDGILSRPPLGFPIPVNDVPNQMNRFIGQGSQMGRDPRPPTAIGGPALGGPGPIFDQPPWLGILSMEPIGGVAPFPRFRRAIDSDGNKSEKSENSKYFSTYHRLRSPFSEAAVEPSPTPVLTDQQPLPEQRHVTDKQHSDPLETPNVDQTVNSNSESSRIRSHGLESQRNRGSASTNDEPAEKAKSEKNQDTENLDVDQTWLPPNLPILGYPVVLGFDPWMFGGYPNWGLLGRRKREDDGINSEEAVSSQQDSTDVNADGETGLVENGNRTDEGDDFEEWATPMPSPPGFSMLPWDFWMAWNFDNAMWDVMSLLHELNSRNSSDASNDTDTNDPQRSRSEQMQGLEAHADSKDDGHVEEGNNRHKRSSDGNATDDEVKEAKESANNTKDHDKRYAQVPGRSNGFNWPFFMNRGPPPQYIPVYARYWPVVIPPPNGYRTWGNIGNIGSFPSLWANPVFPRYPWSNGNEQFNLWENMFRLNRFKREADGDNTKSNDEESEREQRSQEAESSRRESSQGSENSAGSSGDSVWRSASRKYATKDNWEQQGNTATDDRYDYTSSGMGNQEGPTQARPAQPGWLKNMLSGTGDRWKNAQSQQYRHLWDQTYAQPYDEQILKQNVWSNAAPGILPPTFMTPGSTWPNWDGSFDGSMFLNHDGINTFGGMDPRSGYPFWMDQWSDSLGGSPRNWFSLRDTSSNFNDLNSLMKLWYGRFSRDAQLNATAEDQFKDKDQEEKEQPRQKRDALSEDQTREKRWESVFGGIDSPFSSSQQVPSWGAWCKVYWNVARHKRDTPEADNSNDNIMKRNSIPKGSKEKRWNEWNDNQHGTNWLSTFLDMVCPLVLPASADYDWQVGIADSLPDTASSYLQFRNKREAETENSLRRDSTAGDSQTTRLERWWNPYSDDYDCLEWISSVSAWSPWKGWNLLRASRENTAFRSDSNEKHAADTQVRSYDSKDNRAVRCREWYRKYRESNRKSRGENSKDDNDEGFEEVRHQQTDDVHQDNSDSQVRHRRDISESDRLKRQGQLNFQPSLWSPYSSSQPWNRHSYHSYYQNPPSWLGPDMYPSFSYNPRRNNPFEFARGLRHSDYVAEGVDPTSQQRQKRSNEDVDRSKRFWSPGNSILGFDWADQNRWSDNGNQWGWPGNSFNSRPPMFSAFTGYRNPQSAFPMHDWIRHQRNVEKYDQSGDGKHNTENGSVGRRKRESMLTGFQQGGVLGNQNAHPWFGDFRQQANPGFWNDYSGMLNRHRRDTNFETDEGRGKRFAGWGNLIPNTWNDLMQQSFGPIRNAWASYPHNQFNNWRYTRDVDSQTAQDASEIKEREIVENSKTKRQLSPFALYSTPQGLDWGRSREHGNIVPQYYNYWGGFPRMDFNRGYRPEELWGGIRFARESDDNDKVDDSHKTSQNEGVSRAKRWADASYNSRAFNDWNSGSGFYGTFNPYQWEGTNKWNTRDFYRRSGEPQDSSRSRRSTDDSNKEKRWFGHQGVPRAPTLPWWQKPFSNAAQIYASSYQNPLMQGFDSQRGSTYPWSKSWNLFQRDPYSGNEDFPSRTQFWRSPWDSYRFPRKSNDQGESRIKRDTQNDGQMKRWSGYQNPLISHSYPQSGLGWQQGNSYPWSESWNPFLRGSYGKNDGFPTQFWGSSWDSYRYPRKSNDQADSRIKRDTQHDGQMKRWSRYQNPLISQSYPQSGLGWQQGNAYPWSESWNPFQRGSYGRNEGFPTQSWGNSWDFQRYPRHLKEQGESRVKRDTRNNTRMKRLQPWSNSRFPLSNVQNPYGSRILGSNEWVVGEYGRADNFWNPGRYPREARQETKEQSAQDGKVNKRWFMNEQYQWPINRQFEWPMNGQYQFPVNEQYPWPVNGQYQRPINNRWFPYSFLNRQWGGSNWNNLRYTRKAMGDSGKIKKRSIEAWNFNRPWQTGGSEPSVFDPQGSRYFPSDNWQGSYINYPTPFGFQGLGEWAAKVYIRQAEGEKIKERTKRDTETKKIEKRWEGGYRNPFTNTLNWDWSPYNTGYERSGFYGAPTLNWDREYASNSNRFQRSPTENTSQDRHKREVEQEARNKRWQGNQLLPSWLDRRQDVYGLHSFYGPQNRYDSGNNWGGVWAGRRQPGWDNVWNQARYRRSLDQTEATKSKRWQQSAIPWSAGYGQSPWKPQGQMNLWSRDWGGNSAFGTESWRPAGGFQWNSPTEGSLGRGFGGYGNMWRFPRQTSDSTDKNIGNRQKREADDSNRDKRWHNWNTNPFFNWDSWPLDATYTNPWYSRYTASPSLNTRSFFKRETKESKNDQELVDDERETRTKRWQFGTGFPSYREDSSPLANRNPFGFISGWDDIFGSAFAPKFYRGARQANADDRSKLTNDDSSRKKRSYSDSYFPFAFPSLQNRGMGIPTMSTHPWNTDSDLWDSNWDSRRYRRSTESQKEENKENVDSDNREKRENYWDNVYGNSWGGGTVFPTRFANPWTSNNNYWWANNWNSGRYRRSADGRSEGNKENVEAGERNKRENFWDNVYGNSWYSEGRFPTTYGNPGIYGNNLWGRNWNSGRFRRSAEGISNGNKENTDSGDRNKRENLWDNVYGNNWSSGGIFPTTYANPGISGYNLWDRNWISDRFRRSTDNTDEENIDSGIRSKRGNYWDNVYGKSWGSGIGFPATSANPWTSNNNWWANNWNSRRYRRSVDGRIEGNKENVDASERNKRENFWDNVYRNGWSSGGRFPATFANPWTSRNNWWDSNWIPRRYRKSTDEVVEQSQEASDSGGRNKRQNYWDNVFGQTRNKNWLSPNWPLGGTYPYEIIFVLSPFVGSWTPNFGQQGFGNRNWNRPAERYFRDTTNAQETTNTEDGDRPTSRNKRSLNFDFMRGNGWNTNDYFNPAGDNSYTFPQRNSWNPYYGTNNRFLSSGQRFYRHTEDENGSVSKERFKREADDGSRVKRFGNPYWNYANYPPMYYANSWGQEPIFDTNNWFSPVSPWYMAPRMAQFRNPWYNPFFFGVLRNLRQIKDADVNETIQRERREAVSKEPRQAQWFDFYNNPFGYDSFQRDNPFRGMPFGLRNPASRGQNLYMPWKSFSSWDSGMAPTSFQWARGPRETDTENDDQNRSKRDAWGSHVGRNVFGSDRSYGSKWNNPSFGGIDPINPWSSEQRQFWNTNRPGMFGQQWRNNPSFQWGQGLSGYSPVHFKRDSENTQGATQDNGETRTKRGVGDVTSQRNKRWWRYSGTGELKPQDRTWTEWQMGFDNSNPLYPETGNAFWSDRTRGMQFRKKRDVSVEDPLKKKRWVPFGGQSDAFSSYGLRNPGSNQRPPPSWYSGQGFNQQNPGYPLWGTYENQGSPFWNGAASYRKRRSQGDPMERS